MFSCKSNLFFSACSSFDLNRIGFTLNFCFFLSFFFFLLRHFRACLHTHTPPPPPSPGPFTRMPNGKCNMPGPIERNVFCFMPFYALYVFLMGLQIQFAQSTFGIGRRYRRLNRALDATFRSGKFFFCWFTVLLTRQ